MCHSWQNSEFRICESPGGKKFLNAAIYFQNDIQKQVATSKLTARYLEPICNTTKSDLNVRRLIQVKKINFLIPFFLIFPDFFKVFSKVNK